MAYKKIFNKVIDEELRLVLIGISGSGKSSTGNSILGEVKFDEKEEAVDGTKYSTSETVVRNGLRISVTDTVGLHSISKDTCTTFTAVAEILMLMSPGPHAILVTVEGSRITREVHETINEFKKLLGESCVNHMIFVFTHGDQLFNPRTKKTKSIEDYCGELKRKNSDMNQLLTACGDRFVSINNRISFDSDENKLQTDKLITVVQQVIKNNGGGFYQNKRLQGAEKVMQVIDNTTGSREVSRKVLTGILACGAGAAGAVGGTLAGALAAVLAIPIGTITGTVAGVEVATETYDKVESTGVFDKLTKCLSYVGNGALGGVIGFGGGIVAALAAIPAGAVGGAAAAASEVVNPGIIREALDEIFDDD